MKTITICGGGNQGHVIAGWLSSNGYAVVNILTNKPDQWNSEIFVKTPEGVLMGNIKRISSHPEEVIPKSDVVLLCLPGFLIKETLLKIKPFLASHTFVGTVFSSTGFFFEAADILDMSQPLWGFQRVPFISRVMEYGSSAQLLGYKDSLNISVENCSIIDKIVFASIIQKWFERPVKLLRNYLEASLTNSTPLLHTSRLYTMFGGENEGRVYDRMVLFYEEWTEEAAELYIKMDQEFFRLLRVLPVTPDFLLPVLDYYECHDAKSLAAKLSSIQAFKGIASPMKYEGSGWVADYESRYFTEDFPFGLSYIWQLGQNSGVPCPNIDKVYEWGIGKILGK